jgi:membrane peptidoglycan carboxypeptidase
VTQRARKKARAKKAKPKARPKARSPKDVLKRFAARIGGKGRWWTKTLRWGAFLAFAGVVGGALTFLLAYQLIGLPEANAEFKTQTTNVYYSDGITKIGTFYNQDRVAVKSDQISPSMKNAIIAAEDRTFYTNRGVSVSGIARAFTENASSGEITAGGSTITQQYVKILYLNQERTYTRKFKEAILSLKVDRRLTKDQILTGYLNTIYYGNGSYGVEVAANNYFGVDASDLTIPQAAYLATVVNSPTYYDPYEDGASERILPRYHYVLNGMLASGSITKAEHDQYYDQLPQFTKTQPNHSYGGTNGYLLQMVQSQMRDLQFSDYEINGGGLKIVTTFDKSMQDDAVKAVQTVGPQAKGYDEINSALVSVQPGTGAVKSLYGGADYLKTQLNWATVGTQPGSTFKAFAVVAALENGYSLKTILNGNSPIKVAGASIENQGDSGGESKGQVTLKYATQDSINTAFVDLTGKLGDGNYQTGATKIIDAAVEAGIPSSVADKINPVPITALGYYPVAPIDMANAYATLLNGGERANWYIIETVDDANGTQVYKHTVQTKRTMSADVAADTLVALQSVVASGGTGTLGRTICPTAGKTGTATASDGSGSTSQHVSSSWFMGLTPTMATAVMNNRGDGNDALDGYLNTFYGGRYPAQEFSTYANSWLTKSTCGTFAAASNITASTGAVESTTTSATPTTAPTTQVAPTTAATSSSTPTPTASSTVPSSSPTVQGLAGILSSGLTNKQGG